MFYNKQHRVKIFIVKNVLKSTDFPLWRKNENQKQTLARTLLAHFN